MALTVLPVQLASLAVVQDDLVKLVNATDQASWLAASQSLLAALVGPGLSVIPQPQKVSIEAAFKAALEAVDPAETADIEKAFQVLDAHVTLSQFIPPLASA